MSITTSKSITTVSWSQQKTNTGFAVTKQGADSKSFSVSPSTSTYNEILLAQYTILAAGTQDVDFYSFTNLLGQSVTATKVLGIFLKATGNNGQLRIAPHPTTNPITWFFGGTTPTITLECGTGGCMICLMDGTTQVVSATDRSLRISNPGSATITVDVVAFVGT